MSSQAKRYKYTVVFRDGTFYQSDIPYPEPSAWDKPLTHLILSYRLTGSRIAKAYLNYFKEKLT